MWRMLIIWKCFCLSGLVWLWQHYLHVRSVSVRVCVCVCVCVCLAVRQTRQCTGRCWPTLWLCVRSTPSSWGTPELASTDRETSTSSLSVSLSSPLSGTAPIGLPHTHTVLFKLQHLLLLDFIPLYTVNYSHFGGNQAASRFFSAELPDKEVEVKHTSSRSGTVCYFGSLLQFRLKHRCSGKKDKGILT